MKDPLFPFLSMFSLIGIRRVVVMLLTWFMLAAWKSSTGLSGKAGPSDYSLSGSSASRLFGAFNGVAVIATSYGNGIIPEIQVIKCLIRTQLPGDNCQKLRWIQVSWTYANFDKLIARGSFFCSASLDLCVLDIFQLQSFKSNRRLNSILLQLSPYPIDRMVLNWT